MSTVADTYTVEILTIGLPHSGKSTFVNTICPRTAIERGWQTGYLPVDQTLDVRFLEPPARVEFDFIWLRELIGSADVDGFMVICDSTQPRFFGETIGLLQSVRAYHPDVPLALVANFQDREGAWPVNDIRFALGIPADILVLPCVAHHAESVKDVVLQMLYKIFER